MAQIFGKSSNSFARASLVGAFAGSSDSGAWSMRFTGRLTRRINRAAGASVPFSHQHHVAGLGLDCRYCHTSVENSSFAGIPPTETCMTCHSQVWTDAPVLAPVRQSLATRQPLQWKRVNDCRTLCSSTTAFTCRKASAARPATGQWIKCRSPGKNIRCTCAGAWIATKRRRSFFARATRFSTWNGNRHQINWSGAGSCSPNTTSATNRLQQLRDCSMCHR